MITQLIAHGLHGNPGKDVQLHVMVEQEPELETNYLQISLDLIVKVLGIKMSLAMNNVVLVNIK